MSGDAGSLPNSGGDTNRIEDLLDSPEWHEKLARAREQREKILAERALLASTTEKRRKPWEMPPPERKASRQPPTAFPRLDFSPDELVRGDKRPASNGQVVSLSGSALRDSQPDDNLTAEAATQTQLDHVDEFILGRALPVERRETNDSTPNDAAASNDASFQKTVSRILGARQDSIEKPSEPKIVPILLDAVSRADVVPDAAISEQDVDKDVWVPTPPATELKLPETAPAAELASVAAPTRSAGQRSLEAIPVSKTLDTLMPQAAVVSDVASVGQRKPMFVMAAVVVAAIIGAAFVLVPDENAPVTEQTTAPQTGTEAAAAPPIELAAAPAAMTGVTPPSSPEPETGSPISAATSVPAVQQSGPVLTMPVAGAHDPSLTAIPDSSRIVTMSEVVDIAAPTVALGPDVVAGFVDAQGGLAIASPGAPVERPEVSRLPEVELQPAAFQAPEVMNLPLVSDPSANLVSPGQDDQPAIDLPLAEAPAVLSMTAPAVVLPDNSSEAIPLVTATAAPPVEATPPEAAETANTTLAPVTSAPPPAKPEIIAGVEPTAPKVTDGIDLSGISVHMLAPSSIDPSMMDQTVALLAGEGFALAAPKSVDLKITYTQVRYYHAADAAAAIALAKLTNAEPRDFSDAGSRPPSGTVELWFAGVPNAPAVVPKAPSAKKSSGGVAKAAAKKSVARKAAPAPAVDNEAVLRDRILRQLRGGEHLKKK